MRDYSFYTSLPMLLLWCAGCMAPSPSRGYRSLSKQEKNLADSLLLYALDREALFTLLDTLKPISSVKMLRYPIAPDSTHIQGTVSRIKNPLYLDTLDRYYLLNQKLTGSKVEFVMIPFKASDKEYKNIQLYAVRKSVLQKSIAEQANFFGQFGITKNTPAQTVINIIEGTQAYDRWRGYGYLFGYPNHAIDFFVEAGKQQDSTSKFVKRQFFNMPVYAGNSGYFTYALPKDYNPGNIDSAIYQQASNRLAKYKQQREKWVSKNKLRTRLILKEIQSGNLR